jgi:hypothetical protein
MGPVSEVLGRLVNLLREIDRICEESITERGYL